jgi:hypothetical protein
MGQVMADMTPESRRMVMKWVRNEDKDMSDPESVLKADTIEEAYQKNDWLFIFEAAMVMHMHAGCTVDETTILEWQEKSITKLKNMKHEQGSIQVWLQQFNDGIKECETMGATISNELKCIYLMQNINKKIFEQTLILWRGVLARKTFLDKNDTLKAYIMNEYSSQMTQTEHAKIIYNVISAKRKLEQALNVNKAEKQNDKGKCHVCRCTRHKMKKCWYYDSIMTLEDKKKVAKKKIKERQASKDGKNKQMENKKEAAKMNPKMENPAEVHKGTIVHLPPKEQTGMCLI